MMETDYVTTIDDTAESAKTAGQEGHSFRRFLSRSWRYAIVAIVAFILGFATSCISSQAKMLSLLEEIDSFRIEKADDLLSLTNVKYEAERAGYEQGYYSGYKDAEKELDEQYEVGYNFNHGKRIIQHEPLPQIIASRDVLQRQTND